MKKYLLGLAILFLSFSAEAFFENENIEIPSQNITVRVEEQAAKITFTQTLHNTSKKSQDFFYILPFFQNSSDISVFLDAEKQSPETLVQKEAIRNLLWEKAESTKIPEILDFSQAKKILVLPKVSISPKEKKDLKFVFSLAPEIENTWNAIELHQPKQNISKNEIRFQSPSKSIPHFFHSLPKGGLIHRDETSFSYLSKTENVSSDRNMLFLWNTEKTATAQYKNFLIEANLLPETKPISTAFFLIDASGSMYGSPWDITEDAVQTLLTILPQKAQINSGLISETLEKSQEFFAENTPETQKTILNTLRNTDPVGKADISAALTDVPESDLTILITDDPNIKIPEKSDDWLILHFNPLTLDTASLNLRGISVLPLWKHTFQFLQQDALKKKLSHLRLPITAPEKSKNDHTYQPKSIRYFDDTTSNISVQETPIFSGKKWKYFQIFETLWAQFRMAEILQQYQRTQNAPLEAFFAVAQTFGIESVFSTPESFEEKDFSEFSQEIFRLMTNAQIPPLKNTSKNQTTAHSERDFSVQPFSEAHETLFKKIPEIFSNAFSSTTPLCGETRCVSFDAKHGKKFLRNIDRTFWKPSEVHHWGYAYLREFVEEGIFDSKEAIFEIEPDKPVSRGEFANAVYQYYSWRKPKKYQEKFSDVADDHPYAEAIQFLRDQNIINGYADNTFRPGQTISRAEAVKIILSIYRKIPASQKISGIFADTPGWEGPWAEKAFGEGIIQGIQKNEKRYFHPHKAITRAEMAKIIIE